MTLPGRCRCRYVHHMSFAEREHAALFCRYPTCFFLFFKRTRSTRASHLRCKTLTPLPDPDDTPTGALQSLLQVAHRLGNLLRGSWHVVLDTLEQAATLLTRRAIARPRWSPNALAEAELEAVEQHCLEVFEAGVR